MSALSQNILAADARTKSIIQEVLSSHCYRMQVGKCCHLFHTILVFFFFFINIEYEFLSSFA